MNDFDSSALIKRFVLEEGSRLVDKLISIEPTATAKIAYAEVHSSLMRKKREGNLADTDYASACRRFEQEWETYARIDLRDELLVVARDLIRRYPLRALDSIHLASAVQLKMSLGESLTFVATDGRLLSAAKAEGFRVLNPAGD